MKFFVSVWIFIVTVYAQDLIEFDYELDAYYSNVSAFIDLDKNRTVINGNDLSEAQIYTNLLYHALKPNIFLVEASIYPMPVFGVYFRKNHEHIYDQARIDDFNIVKSLTAGFEEPYALSFFIGRMMVFSKKNKTHVGKNRAYMGVLLSIGDKTIKDNKLYNNKWYEVELKLKGTREKEDSDLDWSFRVGSRIHTNEYFVDSLYLGMRRSSIDYKKKRFSFVYNSAYTTLIEFNKQTLEPIKVEILLEKKFPLSMTQKMVFGLEVGYLYVSADRFRGILQTTGVDNHQLILRPNLKF